MQDELRVKNNILFLDFMAIEMVIYYDKMHSKYTSWYRIIELLVNSIIH